MSPTRRLGRSTLTLFAVALTLLPAVAFASGGGGHGEGPGLGAELGLYWAIPFVGILLSIALFPLLAPEFWHHHFPKVAAGWAALFGIPFLIVYKGEAVEAILHIYLVDYIPFIVLLWALFTVAGGIVLKGTLRGSPAVNALLLLVGTVLASWIGTTGASMLLIRPVIRANAWRTHRSHLVVFFIFLVSNIGGSLTPLGDPPLFLGFLHHVPFFWTFHVFPEMALASAMLLAGFFVLDTFLMSKEPEDVMAKRDEGESIHLRLEGAHNFLFLAGVIAFVLFSGYVHLSSLSVPGSHLEIPLQNIVRDLGLIGMGILSMKTTSAALREANGFTWFPIIEVAYLFAGIFMTIIPALAILGAGEHGAMAWLVEGVKTDVHYFWVTGALSSFLDNAPTYLTFFNTALGSLPADHLHAATEAERVAMLIQDRASTLAAISIGAVFMGANSYIGNAPNFMVKAIAEESGVAMPSFFGYIFKWSLPILIPTFVVITLVFL